MRPELFRFVSLVASFILAGSTLIFARVTDGERINFAADFLKRLNVVKDRLSFGFGEHAIPSFGLIRRTASKLQRQVAEQNAKTYITKLSPEKKQELKQKKVRYLAVSTVRSPETSQKAKEVVRIWDIPRETFANTNVYELDTTPAKGKLASYEGMVAENIGH
jgi:hypothetical protein